MSDHEVTWCDAILFCVHCDSFGIARSPVTGARGRCRHPYVTYVGHEAEQHPAPTSGCSTGGAPLA